MSCTPAAAAILDIELIDYIKFGRVGWRSLANVYLHPQTRGVMHQILRRSDGLCGLLSTKMQPII